MKILIRAIQERIEYVEYLKKYLPDAEFVFDKNRNAMDTFLAAMSVAGGQPCLHMEDDIILTKDFKIKALKIIQSHENEVIQFFSMRKDDIEVGSRYDYGRNFMMNQCFYLPEGYSKAIKEFYEQWNRKEEHPTGYDILMADWLKSRKEKYWIHVPSLVQHRQCKSLINPKRSAHRQSITFEEGIE